MAFQCTLEPLLISAMELLGGAELPPELVTAGERLFLGLFLGLPLLLVADVCGQDKSWSILSLLIRTLWAPLLTWPYLSSRGDVDHPETC